jgi:hypothetical protein
MAKLAEQVINKMKFDIPIVTQTLAERRDMQKSIQM